MLLDLDRRIHALLGLGVIFTLAMTGATGSIKNSLSITSQSVTPSPWPTATPTPEIPAQQVEPEPLLTSSSSSTLFPVFDRGLDPSDVTVWYFDDFYFTDLVLAEPWVGPIDFQRPCFGEPGPYEGCKLHPALAEGGNYSVRWEGTLQIPADGDYTFRFSNVDDEADLLLKIGGVFTLVMESGGSAPNPAPAETVHLEGPIVEFRVEFKQFVPGAASLTLHWAGSVFAEEVIPELVQYDCAGELPNLSPIALAVLNEVGPQNFCFNSYDDLFVLPPGKAGFQRFADLASTARHEVDFATMIWEDEFVRADDTSLLGDNGPGVVFLQGIKQLYQQVIADPSQYPQGVRVRILLGLQIHEGISSVDALDFGSGNSESTTNDQRVFVRQALEHMDRLNVPLSDTNWEVEVAAHRNSSDGLDVFPINGDFSHVKMLIVDGRTVAVTGFNMDYGFLDLIESEHGIDQPIHDMALQITGPVAQDALDAFDTLWSQARRCTDHDPEGGCTSEDQVESIDHSSPVNARKFAYDATPTYAFSLYRDDNPDNKASDRAIRAALEAAQSNLNILQFHYWQDEPIPPFPRVGFGVVYLDDEDTLDYVEGLTTAVENGVDVRLLVSKSNWRDEPINELGIANLYRTLEDVGIPAGNLSVRYFMPGNEYPLLHTKALSADGQFIIVGSQNWDWSAFGDFSSEARILSFDLAEYNLAVASSDAATAFDSLFEQFWLDSLPHLTAEEPLDEFFDELGQGDAVVFLPPGIYSGGIYLGDTMHIVGAGPGETIVECSLPGVGFTVEYSNTTISSLTIRGCDVGIELLDSSPGSLENVSIGRVVFDQNEYAGITVSSDYPGSPVSFNVENSTFLEGEVGIELNLPGDQSVTSRVRNNIFVSQYNAPISVLDGDGGRTEYSFNLFSECSPDTCITDWVDGAIGSGSSQHDNLFDEDPNFINLIGGDFDLAPGSPAIEAGDPATISNWIFDSDEDGVARIDIGAHETGPDSLRNLPPDPSGGGPYSGLEGSPVLFDGSASQDPEGSALEYRWDFDNDAVWDTDFTTDPAASFTYSDDYDGYAALEARDDIGLTGVDMFPVQVFNVAPSVDAGPDQLAAVGEPVLLSGSFTDPGSEDAHTIEWEFDNGEFASGTLTPTISFATAGTYQVLLTVTDDDGGVGTASALVTIASGESLDIADFVVFGVEGVWAKQNAVVLSGDIGANVSSPGPYLAEGSEVTIGIGADLIDPASRVLGDSVYLKDNSQVYDAYYNELGGLGTVFGQHHTPVQIPLFSSLPEVPAFSPGTQDFDVPQGGSLALDAGSYGLLRARLGSMITFSGGVYDFSEWDVGQNVQLHFQAPSEIRIAGKLAVDQGSYLGPEPGAGGVGARDIVIYVTGINGSSGNLGGTPDAAKFGISSEVQANVYVPNGTLWLRQNGHFTGGFIGRWVILGIGATAEHLSQWTPGG